jgi:hypothetical protein
MPRTVPTPLAAAIGLVPAVLSGVRALPGRVVSIPIYAVSSALSSLDATRQGYDDLAERGERLVARLRGTSVLEVADEVEDAVEDALQGTPVAGLYDAAEDAAEDVVASAGRALRSVGDSASTAVQNAGEAAQQTASAAADAAEALAAVTEATAQDLAQDTAQDTAQDSTQETAEPEVPADEAPKGAPTPKAPEPGGLTRVDSAATADVQETVEQVATTRGGVVLAHDDLPLADYDHMTLGSLRGRLRSLSVEQLVQLRDYEKAHADRLPVVTMLDNRIAKLATDPAAQPTGKTDAPVPELQPSQIGQGGSKVQPATGGPAQNPPSQGDPTNPAQPR